MRLIGLLIAVVLGIGAFLATMNMQKNPQSAPSSDATRVVEVPKVVVQEVPTVDILVARSAIPVGTAVNEGMLDRQPWPSHLVLEDFVVSDGQDKGVLGLVTRSPFQTREPLIRSKLSNPNDPSFLAAGLDKGMRAVTMAVDTLSSVAGFVFPGDRVDVLINHRVSLGKVDPTDPRSPEQIEDIMEVLIPNVKVIAVDQFATTVAGQGPRVPGSVTVEVSRQDAQRLKLGESKGKLVLALRPLAVEGDNEEDVARPTGMTDLSRITPPSYFPILYDPSGEYSSVVLNPFVEGEDKLSDKKREEIAKTMERAAGTKVAGRPGKPQAMGAGSSSASSNKSAKKDDTTKVTVVRGVQKDQVEVSQP